MPTPTELRLQSRNDRLELIRSKHEGLLAERGDGNLSDTDKDQIRLYREETAELMTEIEGLSADLDAHNKAIENSVAIRRAMLGSSGVEEDGDGVVYRDFKRYVYDTLISRETPGCRGLVQQWGVKDDEIEGARARLQLLKRTPANTLSSNIGGLTPPQHIAQIFQVIQTARPLIASARQVDLDRGTLTYPNVTQRPVVAVQATEKTEAGNTGMVVEMETITADTYLGGGDLSWQAINWSTPNALELWFDLVADDYALKTETAVAELVTDSGFDHAISSPLGATPSFADFMTAVGAGGAKVYADSKRMANTVYLAPDRWWYLFGLTSDAQAMFTTANVEGVGPLTFVASRGLESGEIVVGDRNGLLVAETPGAPVELRVVEPAIGGLECGLIGALAAAVADDGAFSLITTAS